MMWIETMPPMDQFIVLSKNPVRGADRIKQETGVSAAIADAVTTWKAVF
jgi:hypothetical protein